MKHFSLLIFSIGILSLTSCSKESSPGNTNTAPTNLTLSADVSTDNSGNVTFKATAGNTASFDYNFGNGIFKSVVLGNITYKYPESGNYTVTVTAKSAGGQTILKTIDITVTVKVTLIWSEEFNTDGAPDPAKWGYDLGAGGWGNAELEYYTSRPENVIVQGGVLKIKAIKENYMGSAYTSTRMLSKDKFAFTYGKVEVSAKLPAGGGTWPAIWMLGSNIGTVSWPACGEIDIMEHLGNDLNKIYGTVHYPGHSGGSAIGSTRVITNATTEFHKYTLEWSATAINISVDDYLFFNFPNNGGLPFNQDFFLILNIAMGGNFGGTIDPAFSNATMEVDYIRVYR